jgi:hypothetical protein
VYDGRCSTRLEGSNIDDYVKTMERLRDLPVTVVHGGHEGELTATASSRSATTTSLVRGIGEVGGTGTSLAARRGGTG